MANEKPSAQEIVQEWKDLLTKTVLYHAERMQIHAQTFGRTKLSMVKNRLFSHPYILNYQEKIGFRVEHLSQRLAGAVTHRDWHAVLDALKSIIQSQNKRPPS